MRAMSDSVTRETGGTLDETEVARFAAMASEWWDPNGKFRPLHAINPTRLGFIREQVCTHFGRGDRSIRPFEGLAIADIGCGGGLLCEPMARLGARVTGLDPAEDSIKAAHAHAVAQGLEIDYRAERAEDTAARGSKFDIVIAMEVVEHVPDVPAFINVASSLVAPGGMLLLSTINRTVKSYALAIVGAEFVLRWVPVGTHRWDRFVMPDELAAACRLSGLSESVRKGMVFNPLTSLWHLSEDTDVNYLMAATKPATP